MTLLDPDVLQLVLARLGLGPLSNDLDGLREFYRAWCLSVPFDDLQKTLVLFENPGPPLPPLDANQFFRDFLHCGTGGTCWQHSDAKYTLLRDLGFDARRALASMYDTGQGGHGTVIVFLPDGTRWLLDNAFLTMEPMGIDPMSRSSREGTFSSEVEHEDEKIYLHGYHPPMENIFFRLLEFDVPESLYAERWSKTYLHGPFVKTAHIRRNFEDRFVVLRGDTLFTCVGDHVHQETLDAEGVVWHLKETFSLSPEFVDRWAKSGALESNMLPAGPLPDLPQRLRPSRR